MVASLFAVKASPAVTVNKDSRANYTPSFSACVGPALEDAGFTDLGTLDAADANINCLAYYKISAGYPDGTFDPKSNVTRSQMALFLYPAANRADIDLMGGDMAADFGDIPKLGENRQNAINPPPRPVPPNLRFVVWCGALCALGWVCRGLTPPPFLRFRASSGSRSDRQAA